jgi:exodeoxyribonuclease VII small subunit
VSFLSRALECSHVVSTPLTNDWRSSPQLPADERQGLRVNSPAPKKPEAPRKPDFERSLARLEEVVRRLESPQLSLDDAMQLFEEGVALSRECQKQLEEAEGRVEILLKKADGKLAPEPFDPEAENES